MIPSPGGPFPIDTDAGLITCFDVTSTEIHAWLCRLLDGDHELVESVLPDVYIRAAEIGHHETPIHSVDPADLESIAFHLATDAAGQRRADGALDVTERAVLDLSVRQQRAVESIAAVTGLAVEAVDAMCDGLRRRRGDSGQAIAGDDPLRSSQRWLDDATRRRARSAVIARKPPPRPPVVTNPASPGSGSDRAPTAWALARDRPPDHTALRHDPPRPSRRPIALAAIGITALLAAMVVWVSTSSDDDPVDTDAAVLDTRASGGSDTTDPVDTPTITDAPEPTTEPSSNPTRPSPSSTSTPGPPPFDLSPGYLVTALPAGLEPRFVSEQVASSPPDQQYYDSWFQLWAEPGTSAAGGRWMAISTGAFYDELVPSSTGASRVIADDVTAVTRQRPDGVVEYRTRIATGPVPMSVSIAAFGFAEQELAAIASSLVRFEPTSSTTSIIGVSPLEPGPQARSTTLLGLEVIESGPTWCCGVHGPADPDVNARFTGYSLSEPDSWGTTLVVTVKDTVRQSEFSQLSFERSQDPDAPTNPASTIQVGDRLVHVSGGSWTDPDDVVHVYSGGWWIESGETITVQGEVTIAELVAAIASARPATVDEWEALHAQLASPEDQPYIDEMSPASTVIPMARVDDGPAWRLTVNDAATTIQIDGIDDGSQLSGTRPAWSLDPLHPVTEFVAITATVLVIALEGDPMAAQVRVTAGARVRVVPLTTIAETDVMMAIDAFAETGPYTVELLDATGATIRVLAP